MERTWAYVYSFLTLFDLSRKNPGVEISGGHSKEVDEAFDLLNWANGGENLKERLKWPGNLPRPDSKSIDPKRLTKTNDFFLGVLAFILLHELAHIELGHTALKNSPREEKQQHEMQADRWAAVWLLERISDHSKDEWYRINRCNWVMLALSILNLVEYNNRNGLPTSHPPTLERILAFSDEFSPESEGPIAPITDFPLFLACSIIGCQAMNLGVGESGRVFDSLRDRLIYLYRKFEDKYRA